MSSSLAHTLLEDSLRDFCRSANVGSMAIGLSGCVRGVGVSSVNILTGDAGRWLGAVKSAEKKGGPRPIRPPPLDPPLAWGTGTGGTLWFAWPDFTSQVIGFLHEEENVYQISNVAQNRELMKV